MHRHMTTPKQWLTFRKHKDVPSLDKTNAIRAAIETMLVSGQLILDTRDNLTNALVGGCYSHNKEPFTDEKQVLDVLREYQSVGWDCTLETEMRPTGRQQIIFKEPDEKDFQRSG